MQEMIFQPRMQVIMTFQPRMQEMMAFQPRMQERMTFRQRRKESTQKKQLRRSPRGKASNIWTKITLVPRTGQSWILLEGTAVPLSRFTPVRGYIQNTLGVLIPGIGSGNPRRTSTKLELDGPANAESSCGTIFTNCDPVRRRTCRNILTRTNGFVFNPPRVQSMMFKHY